MDSEVQTLGTKKKILIIDTDQASSETLKQAFQEEGFQVETAVSAKQGLVTLDFFQPDLVISDVLLEDHDAGFKLARAIKDHPILSATPIFLLSSAQAKTGTSFDFEKDGYWMKADDYAEKPLDWEDILRRVYALLARS